jgi:hypothetical protein
LGNTKALDDGVKGFNNLLAVVVGIGLALTLFVQAVPELAPLGERLGRGVSTIDVSVEEYGPGAGLASIRILDWNLRDSGPHALALSVALFGLLALLILRAFFAPGAVEDGLRRTVLHQAATTSC